MALNHRFLLRLTTNCTIYLLFFVCFGVVLWVVDEFLGWDILPDAWTILVRALLVAGGVIAFVLVLITLILSLSVIAEAKASLAALPDFQVSRRFHKRLRRSFLASTLVIVLLLGGLQITNQVRARIAFQNIRAELDATMPEVLELFTEPLQSAIATNSLATEDPLSELNQLFNAVPSSFPHEPEIAILMPAAAPYEYQNLTAASIGRDREDKLYLSPEFYFRFPSDRETNIVESLFSEKRPNVRGRVRGVTINNTVPSSWGVLKHNGNVIAIVYMQSRDFSAWNVKLSHQGPDRLLVN